MSIWPASKALRILKALMQIGWKIKHQRGSHSILEREGWKQYIWAFRDGEEIGSKMLARISKKTGLKLSDL